jgi:hypothetical protein
MKVMPSVLGQVAQDVAENLYEVGKSAVKSTVKVVTDVAGESVEQITSAPVPATAQQPEKPAVSNNQSNVEMRKRAEMERLNEVKSELAQYIARKQQLDQKIAEEKAAESQQNKQKEIVEKRKKESIINRIINRAQTNTEKGRLQE